jgi:hypothetical protein
VAGWHASDPGSIIGRDGLYTFGCIPQRFESALRYLKTLIYVFIYLFMFQMCSTTEAAELH